MYLMHNLIFMFLLKFLSTQEDKRLNAAAIADANKVAERKEKDIAARKARKEAAKAAELKRKEDEERFAASTKRRMEAEAEALEKRRQDREARRERELEKMRIRAKAVQDKVRVNEVNCVSLFSYSFISQTSCCLYGTHSSRMKKQSMPKTSVRRRRNVVLKGERKKNQRRGRLKWLRTM